MNYSYFYLYRSLLCESIPIPICGENYYSLITVADPTPANSITMHSRGVGKDRHFCPGKPTYLPGRAKLLSLLNLCNKVSFFMTFRRHLFQFGLGRFCPGLQMNCIDFLATLCINSNKTFFFLISYCNTKYMYFAIWSQLAYSFQKVVRFYCFQSIGPLGRCFL